MTIRHYLRLALALACILIIASPAAAANGKEEGLRKAMVKIFTVSAAPNYYAPWRQMDPNQVTGSGCLIRGNHILTNAHVVSNAMFLQVQPYGDPNRYNAKVKYIAHEIDLAILEVEDDSIFKGIKPLKLGKLPDTLDEVLVYGFPTGGTSLSITKGVLSRVEFQSYSHSNGYFLAGQIDAAINPGNSGGPVIVNNKIVGITMQKDVSEGVDNIGYMIPPSVISHFLTDIKDTKMDGFPLVGFNYQRMDSPILRQKYKMSPKQSGVLINHIDWNSPGIGILREGDVMLTVDGHDIADDGTVEFRPNERADFLYFSHAHQLGEDLKLTVLRNGSIMKLHIPLRAPEPNTTLVDSYAYEKEPRFFVFGGFIFNPITENYICTWKNCNSPERISIHMSKLPSRESRDIVVIMRALPSEINKGYHYLNNFVIQEINGERYVDFTDFYNKIMSFKGHFITLTNDSKQQVVIDREEAVKYHQKIMREYQITKDRSDEL